MPVMAYDYVEPMNKIKSKIKTYSIYATLQCACPETLSDTLLVVDKAFVHIYLNPSFKNFVPSLRASTPNPCALPPFCRICCTSTYYYIR